MKSVIGVLALASMMAGCSHTVVIPDEAQAAQMRKIDLKATLANPDLKMVHFAFNKSTLSTKAKSVLEQDAAALKEDASLKFRIQGFCDDRGSAQYNLALGERRAMMVRGYLENLGIAPDRISVESFGKADPLDTHENEAAYAMNRRANFAIGNIANRASL